MNILKMITQKRSKGVDINVKYRVPNEEYILFRLNYRHKFIRYSS